MAALAEWCGAIRKWKAKERSGAVRSGGEPREGEGIALGVCACIWTPGGGSHGSAGCLELQNGGPGTAPEARQPDLCSTALAMEIGHLGHTRKDGGSSSGCSIRQRALVLFPMSASWLS